MVSPSHNSGNRHLFNLQSCFSMFILFSWYLLHLPLKKTKVILSSYDLRLDIFSTLFSPSYQRRAQVYSSRCWYLFNPRENAESEESLPSMRTLAYDFRNRRSKVDDPFIGSTRAHTLSVPARLNDWEIYTNLSSQMRIPERDDVGDFISRGLISRRANLPVSPLVRAGVRFSIFHPAR